MTDHPMTVMNFQPPKSGMYSPVPTFFKQDETLDLETQVKHARFLEQNGVSGVVLAGTTGENPSMTLKERVDLVKGVADGLKDKSDFVVMGGVNQNCIATAIEEVQALAKAGAHYALMMTPGFFAASARQEDIVRWFFKVADASPIPIIVYYYPDVCNGLVLGLEAWEQLSTHPKIVGAKFTHQNVHLYALVGGSKEIKDNGFSVFTGFGQILLPAMLVGIAGAIDGLSGVFPKTMVNLMTLFKEGHMDEALQLQNDVARMERLIPDVGISGVKQAVTISMGMGETTCRLPLQSGVDQQVWQKYTKDFNKLAKYESTL